MFNKFDFTAANFFAMENELTLRIILLKPPAGVDFGLQKGAGRDYETVQKQRSLGEDLKFEFSVRLRTGDNSAANFLGSFVQGPPSARFVYLDIGTCAGQKDTIWSRRLKIPLTGISPETLNKLSADSTLILEASVPGTGKDGGPSCATIKPFDGWRLVKK